MFKNITSALIACGLVTPVWAATDAIFDDPFFTDSQLTISAKNYWKYLKEENANPKHVHNAWGQGFSAEYQSGYFADIIGFDASYYSAIKLGASDYFNSRGVLYNNGTGNKKSNAEGYSKFGQRNVKLNYTLSGAQLNARWGWQILKNYGVISTIITSQSPATAINVAFTLIEKLTSRANVEKIKEGMGFPLIVNEQNSLKM
ncbi:OprD family outer membrane porin [Klebsiella aerogenes]